MNKLKPYSPGSRHSCIQSFRNLSKKKSEKSLTVPLHRANGRNHKGHITIGQKGGGVKRAYRMISFKRPPDKVACVSALEYDPNRSANIALLEFVDGSKSYILAAHGLKVGAFVFTNEKAPNTVGNCLQLKNMALGIQIHNVELIPNRGGQLVRAAGTSAQIVAQEGNFVTIRLPSSEMRFLPKTCWATVGQVSNLERATLQLGKAGRSRWLNKRPKVRGAAMNAVDHPHGGGEGKAPIGRKHPVTAYGKCALGVKTRDKKKI
jgi:large subunit ribosomal protein L2